MTEENQPTTTSSDEDGYTTKALSARELEWAINPPNVIASHKSINQSIIRTRFPPEPNGYLHIGHAKSMNMNFSLAFDKLGVALENRRTIFRYDDTNPEAESKEYIESLKNDLGWLGWSPERTTYSSDNFGKLHELAVQLIKKGLAYVCDMSKAEMEEQRDLARKRAACKAANKDPDVEVPLSEEQRRELLPGRNRDTSVERNLKLFEGMRLGLYEEGQYTLRLKMDMESSNPNMYDLVAYRIKYVTHPHAGDGWCIYPAYDFTHGICDSLEHVDYSICTLEFETRREPYYWILHSLDLYRPKVYEMSRLNIEYTVLSKRRLLKLVTNKYVRGWDDPRMPTISGLRRRGYTKEILKSFCDDVGATRAMNVVEMEKLYQTARGWLSDRSRRVMAVLDPIKVVVENYEEEKEKVGGEKGVTFEVQNSPTDPKLGSHTVTLTGVFYIDASDFRMEDNKDYYGLAPNKAVGLKYHGGNLICDQVVTDPKTSKITELKCHLDNSPTRPKPKSFITWVPSNAIPAQIRLYNHLFTVPEPSDLWEDEINPLSEIIHPHSLLDPSIKEVDGIDAKNIDKWRSNSAFQFERVGYFVVDLDTSYSIESGTGELVFNRTVNLKQESTVRILTKEQMETNKARAEKQKKDMEAKKARMEIEPQDLFKKAEEYKGLYSTFDDTGLPTTLVDGTELTQSARKKLEKERKKHVKALAKFRKK